ncbi:MAG: hypothetical protein HND52_00870 [Ignavibacteriae bacterium]|nr:hypothetical protein [Ignavibacteriota bacterium]
MEFITDIALTLEYAALIPFYGLIVLLLILKKNKSKKPLSSENSSKLNKINQVI